MCTHGQHHKAFTLLEVLLAAIIFVVSIAGVFATLHAMRTPVINKESALTAAVFGKQVLEALRSQVDASTYYADCSVSGGNPCPDFSLFLGTHQVPNANLPAGISWPAALIAQNNSCDANGCLLYTVSCGDGSVPSGSPLGCSSPNIARRVDLNINWPSIT